MCDGKREMEGRTTIMGPNNARRIVSSWAKGTSFFFIYFYTNYCFIAYVGSKLRREMEGGTEW